ncbi:MAG: histidinol-phosphatase [Campylobacterota bacterium]
MRIDLHNHTTRCNHASGTMQQYILRAIELQIDIFGFSEHAPMEYDQKYRMGFDQLGGYFAEIATLQQQYGKDIEILKALEVDYLPGFMDKRVLEAKVDYLIGSVHFLNGWGFDNPEFIGGYKDKDIDSIYKEYFSAIEKMAQTELFDVVGHLDLIKVFGYKPQGDIKDIVYGALKAIQKSQMVIELNSAGIKKPVKEPYPSKEILQMAHDLGIAITFGSDAHSVDQVGFGYEQTKALAREVGYRKCTLFRNRKPQVVTF